MLSGSNRIAITTCMLALLLCLSFATHAASDSLWGEIDKPLEAPEEAVKKQMAEEAALNPPAAPAATEKTICEVLIAQPRLDMAALNATEMLTKLRTANEHMPNEYKVLVSSNEALDKLYQEYRAKYIQTYCLKE